MNMKKILTGLAVFLSFSLCSCIVTAQEKNLEKSFASSIESVNSTPQKTGQLAPAQENLEMLRQAWTIRGADNQLFQLEYFFPQLVSPVPFNFSGSGADSTPKDFATSVIIPEDETGDSSDNKDFTAMPSIDGLVKNSESTKKTGNQSQTQNQKKQQNQKQQQNQKKQQTQTKTQTKK